MYGEVPENHPSRPVSIAGDQPHQNRSLNMAETRFDVRMTEQLANEFQEIVDQTGLSKSEVFRRAIALYRIAKTANMNKEHVIIRSKDKERELVSI
jgi:antitoxin component of RelBE/YafQ-DinJ toxin-antitoxin module